jgi:hypothetical protein
MKYTTIRTIITASKICNVVKYETAKLCNPEPTMPQWKVTLATTKKNTKKTAFSARTLAAASVISKIEYYTWEFMLYRVTHEHTRLKDIK